MATIDDPHPPGTELSVRVSELFTSVGKYAENIDGALTAGTAHTHVFTALSMLVEYVNLGAEAFRRQVRQMAKHFPDDERERLLAHADSALDEYAACAKTMADALIALLNALREGDKSSADLLASLAMVGQHVVEQGVAPDVDVEVRDKQGTAGVMLRTRQVEQVS